MNAYLIDPIERAITEVRYEGVKDILTHIPAEGHDTIKLQIPDAIDLVYVDDEGSFKTNQFFFFLPNYVDPVPGRGLVLGADELGNPLPPSFGVEWLRARVGWMTGQRLTQLLRSGNDYLTIRGYARKGQPD